MEAITVINAEELKKLLNESKLPVMFSFIKKNGKRRDAWGTTNLELIPEEFHPKGTGTTNDKVISFFDTVADAWKSVSVESKIFLP